MDRRLLILAVLLCAFALVEIRGFPHRTHASQALIASLLPPAIGDFHRTRQWRVPLGTLGRQIEMGANYRAATGGRVTLDFMLNARASHNGVVCWLVAGYPLVGQRLREVRTAHADAVFDVAFFRDNRDLVLLAATECGPARCREHPVSQGVSLALPTFSASAPVPVAILIRTPTRAGQSPRVQREWLASTFDRFTSALDLRSMQSSLPKPRLPKEG